jgi:transposase-like protein
MSAVMEEEIKRWTARRKSQLVLEIIQGRTSVSEASRQFDLPPSEIESWVEEGKRGGWRTRCGPNPRTCASSTSASSRS